MGMGSNSLSQLPDYYGRAQQDASADLGSISKIAGLYQKGLNIGNQQDQLQRRNQARDRFGQAWASGDPNQVEAAMQAFPEFAKQAQEMIGLRDNQHRMDVGSMALQLDGLLQSGDMDSVKAFLQQNAHLLPKGGAFSAQGLISKLDNDDEKGTFRNWLNKYAQSMSIAALKPREIANWGTQQQRLAQQAQRIANQFQLGQERNATQQQRIQSSDHWRGVAHEDRVANLEYRKTHGIGRVGKGPGEFGRQLKLANGQTVMSDGILHGAGANQLYQALDANGNLINIPASSVVSAAGASDIADKNLNGGDLRMILNASDDDINQITGAFLGGGTGKMPLGAGMYTGIAGGSARQVYNAAIRIQGFMQNQGIAAATAMGASGVNTEGEAERYFKAMPQLDYSGPEALKASVKKIQEYTEGRNKKHAVDYQKSSDSGVTGMSDEDLLKGL